MRIPTLAPASRRRALLAGIALTAVLLVLAGCSSGPRKPADTTSVISTPQPHEAPPVMEAAPRGNPPFYEVFGQRYHVLSTSAGYRAEGIASWYGRKFHGRPTSSGEIYDMHAMTAAHPTLPIPTVVRVTNLTNGKSVVVTINDRGPFARNRIIDLSYAAASKIDMIGPGTAPVEVVALNEVRRYDPALAEAAGRSAGVNPEAVTVVPPVSLYMQVGAFGRRDNAERLARQLERAGMDNVHVKAETEAADSVFRVRIGPLVDETEFDSLVGRLARMNIRNPLLVTAPLGTGGQGSGQQEQLRQ